MSRYSVQRTTKRYAKEKLVELFSEILEDDGQLREEIENDGYDYEVVTEEMEKQLWRCRDLLER